MGCPEAEHHSLNTLTLHQVSAHALPNVVMVALRKEVTVHLPHPFIVEGPGVVLLMHDSCAFNPQLVCAAGILVESCFEDPGVIGRCHGSRSAITKQLYLACLRHPDAHDPLPLMGLRTQQRERMIVATFSKSLAVLNHPVEGNTGGHGARTSMAGSLGRFMDRKGRLSTRVSS
ncbi:MAG: Uncharacterised protein [Prochlorococcus marinus str. MIT 9313]|nr:MAG: Uncharacterised protein [Prochlorococcus marinus str. MIT 9313]